MAHAWAQCHLVGINRMMVGVHTLVPGNFAEDHEFDPAYALTSRPKRILQELWLYDVEKMPNAVKISSDEDGFRVRRLAIPHHLNNEGRSHGNVKIRED